MPRWLVGGLYSKEGFRVEEAFDFLRFGYVSYGTRKLLVFYQEVNVEFIKCIDSSHVCGIPNIYMLFGHFCLVSLLFYSRVLTPGIGRFSTPG